jgi:hypothetical protein
MAYVYNDSTGTYDWVEDDPSSSGDPGQPKPYTPPVTTPTGVPGNQWGLGPGGTEDRDLWYWMNNGVTPTGNDQSIFDANGQLRPGWTRTSRGYERTNGTSTGAPPPTTTYGTYGGGGGGSFGAFGDGGPSYDAPDWLSAGDFDPGPAFSYKDFTAPDPTKVGDDPAFQFRFKQGLGALSANRAGAGTFLSGATGKALQDYGQNAASQEYNNIWNRSLSEYDTNRNNAFGNWAAQYGQRKDAYGFKAQDVANHNTFNLTNARNSWDALFGKWSKTGDWLTTIGGYD